MIERTYKGVNPFPTITAPPSDKCDRHEESTRLETFLISAERVNNRVVTPTGRPLFGFAADLSSEAQSARATANKGKTPWRCGPICSTRKAVERFEKFNRKEDRR